MKLRPLPFLYLSPIAALLLGLAPAAYAQGAAPTAVSPPTSGTATLSAPAAQQPAPTAQPNPTPAQPAPLQQAPAQQPPVATQPQPAPSPVYAEPAPVPYQDVAPQPYYEESRRERRARLRQEKRAQRQERDAQRQRYVPGEPLRPGMLPPPIFRYVEGTPLPEGYHVEARANRGLIRAGVVTLALPYLVSAVVGLSQDLKGSSAWLLLPVAGPWLTLSSRRTRCREIGDPTFGGSDCFADEYGAGLLIADGAVQTLGALLITWGALATRDYAVLNEGHLRVTPLHFAHGGYGLALSGAL